MSLRTRESTRSRFDSIVGAIGSIVAPATLISSLMLFFGWTRTSALFGYFGVDTGLLGFTLQDYAIRAVGVAFKPLVYCCLSTALLLAGGRVAILLDGRLLAIIRRRRPNWRIPPLLTIEFCVAIATLAICIQEAFGIPGDSGAVKTPLSGNPTATAIAFTASSLLLLHTLRHLPRVSRVERRGGGPESRFMSEWRESHAHKGPNRASQVIVGALILLGLFWAASLKAQADGIELAEAINAYPAYQSSATVYSTVAIASLQPNLDLPASSPPGDFRYSDLHVLIVANGRWFLITKTRSNSGRSEVAVVKDSDSIAVRVAGPSY